MKRYVNATETIQDEMLRDEINEAIDIGLDSVGEDGSTIHTADWDRAEAAEKSIERELRKRNIDLSYKAINTDYGRVAGNPNSIANMAIRNSIKSDWSEVDLTEDFWDDLYSENYKIYEEDRYGYCKPISVERAEQLLRHPTGSSHQGYGSQAYIDKTTRKVYRDWDDNIKIDISVVRWD